MQRGLFLFAAAFLIFAGCASRIPSETAHRVDRALMERKFFVVTARELESVTATNGALSVQGDLGPEVVLSSAAPISTNGFLLTALHSVKVSDDNQQPWIIDFNGGHPRHAPAMVVWASTNLDVALLKADLPIAHAFTWSHPGQTIRRGTVVFQGGAKSHMASGKIRHDTELDSSGSDAVVIRHTVAGRKGDSGAPLVDETGALVGILSRKLYLSAGLRELSVGGGEAIRPNIHLLDRAMQAHGSTHAGRLN